MGIYAPAHSHSTVALDSHQSSAPGSPPQLPHLRRHLRVNPSSLMFAQYPRHHRGHLRRFLQAYASAGDSRGAEAQADGHAGRARVTDGRRVPSGPSPGQSPGPSGPDHASRRSLSRLHLLAILAGTSAKCPAMMPQLSRWLNSSPYFLAQFKPVINTAGIPRTSVSRLIRSSAVTIRTSPVVQHSAGRSGPVSASRSRDYVLVDTDGGEARAGEPQPLILQGVGSVVPAAGYLGVTV